MSSWWSLLGWDKSAKKNRSRFCNSLYLLLNWLAVILNIFRFYRRCFCTLLLDFIDLLQLFMVNMLFILGSGLLVDVVLRRQPLGSVSALDVLVRFRTSSLLWKVARASVLRLVSLVIEAMSHGNASCGWSPSHPSWWVLEFSVQHDSLWCLDWWLTCDQMYGWSMVLARTILAWCW